MTSCSAPYAASIQAYVNAHRKELVDTLIDIISIPSVKGKPLPGMPYGEGCAHALQKGMELCKARGMTTECYDNYAASAVCGTGDKEIGFVAHLDVVPVSEGWQTDPFTGVERNGFVVGRGSRDNKGGFVAALLAIQCIQELRIPIRSSLRILMGSDEECGMSDMEYVVANCKLPDFSIVTDCLFPVAHGEKGRVCGNILMDIEPGTLRMHGGEAPNIIPDQCVAELPGRAAELSKLQKLATDAEGIHVSTNGQNLVVKSTGISAHASEPFKAVNAIHRLASFLCDNHLLSGRAAKAVSDIQRCFGCYYGEAFGINYEDEASGKTTLITGMVRTEGNALRVNIDSRYSVTDQKERVLKTLQASIEADGWQFELLEATNAHYIPKDHPVAMQLTRIFNAVSGEQKEPYILAGGTYASRMPNAVAFGPGNAKEASIFPYPPGHGDAHQPDESQHIGYLMEAVQIYARGIIELDEILHCNNEVNCHE